MDYQLAGFFIERDPLANLFFGLPVLVFGQCMRSFRMGESNWVLTGNREFIPNLLPRTG